MGQDDGRVLPVVGDIVERVSFDYQFRLLLGVDREVVIETPFRLTTGSTTEVLDPEDARACAPGLSLLHQEVLEGWVSDDGGLHLGLSAGLAVDVPPHHDYEAWQLVHRDGRLLVALPGGGIADFDGWGRGPSHA